MLKRLFRALLPLLMVALLITGCSSTSPTGTDTDSGSAPQIPENGTYTSKEDVALYIHTYQKLPTNFITKKKLKSWAGTARKEIWIRWQREKASVVTGLETMIKNFLRLKAALGKSAISTMKAATEARKELSTQVMV